jgi:hypothetical protein
MLWIFWRRVGTLRGHGIGVTLQKSALASAVMGGASYGIARSVARLPLAGKPGWAVVVAAAGGVGLVVYLGVCALLRVHELALLRALFRPLVQRMRQGAQH